MPPTTVIDDAALRAHHVLVATDNPFQRSARLLQALWREEQGLPIGTRRGQPLGSRLAMPDAKVRLSSTRRGEVAAGAGSRNFRRGIWNSRGLKPPRSKTPR